jgi:hypothetical protein
MEKKEVPEQVSQVENLRFLLKEAISYGYDVLYSEKSFLSSPVDILLDSVIDILLIIGKLFIEGSTSSKPNQGLGFSDKYQDVLGNPKQFKISYPAKYYWDPQAEEIFFRLAEAFVRIKRQENLRQSFHDFVEFLGFNLPQKGSKRKKQANFFWWRRQQRRFRRR